jgi:hypothetical protein
MGRLLSALPDFITEQIGTLSLFEGENNDNYFLKLVFSVPVGQITTQRWQRMQSPLPMGMPIPTRTATGMSIGQTFVHSSHPVHA